MRKLELNSLFNNIDLKKKNLPFYWEKWILVNCLFLFKKKNPKLNNSIRFHKISP